MSVNLITQKCTQCAGELEYIKELKIYRCLYCGSEIERREEYDGLFTIKNVVRQTILDAAYRRLDSAQKNLSECEKIDSKYIGTIIAEITYKMVLLAVPGAIPDIEMRNVFAQIKRCYENLLKINSSISLDEESLYEFLDSSDAYAILVIVYDSLGDIIRRDYLEELLKPSEIFAKEPCKNLLSYALKTKKYDLVDELLKNPVAVYSNFTLSEILNKYPDTKNKIKNILNIFNILNITSENKKILEDYISSSEDSIDTKSEITILAYSKGIKPSLSIIIDSILKKTDSAAGPMLFSLICSIKLSDSDISKIIEFVINSSFSNAASYLNILKKTSQYLLIDSNCVTQFLSRNDLLLNEKTDILRLLLDFECDFQNKESILNNYLCQWDSVDTSNLDNLAETRIQIISVILEKTEKINTSIIETYLLKVNIDKENKLEILKKIFSLDININFFPNLLSSYITSSPDEKEVSSQIILFLLEKGFKIEPMTISKYISSSSNTESEKINFIKTVLSVNAEVRPDIVNYYLENSDLKIFSTELFSLIIPYAKSIGNNAIKNYILFCYDEYKAQNLQLLSQRFYGEYSDIESMISIKNQNVSGNIATVYALCTPDSYDTSKSLLDFFISKKLKPSTNIKVNGKNIKVKKFIATNPDALNSVSEKICKTYKLG